MWLTDDDYDCEFQDKETAFAESGLAFNDSNWALLLSPLNLDSLGLSDIHLNSEVICIAAATAEVRCLTLELCILEDEGVTLVEAVKEKDASLNKKFVLCMVIHLAQVSLSSPS
jgi:hypothetical protein